MSSVRSTYIALCLLTAIPAALTLTVPGAAAAARRHLGFAFIPTAGTPHETLDILLTNARVLLAITIATWAAGRCTAARPALDLTVALIATANTTIVGVAIGAYGPHTIAWLPHLPVEWAALACTLATYVQHRRRPARDAQLGHGIVASTGLLIIAALIESYVTRPTAALVSRS